MYQTNSPDILAVWSLLFDLSLSKSRENTPQLVAGMNRRVGWQAASLGAAKRIRVMKVREFVPQIPLSLLGGDSFPQVSHS